MQGHAANILYGKFHQFHFSQKFIKDYLPHVLELGRNFVAPEYQSSRNGAKSIFAFDNSLRMSCEGLLYTTDRVTFDTLWKATLNSSTAESFSLHLNHPAKVVVFICNPENN